MTQPSIKKAVLSTILILFALSVTGLVGYNLGKKDSVSQVLGVTASTFTVGTDGGGTVTSSPSGLNCGSDCSEAFSDGQTITLTVTPNSGYVLSSWFVSIGNASGSSSGTCAEGNNTGPTCTLAMNSYGVNAMASLIYSTYNATVQKTGTGTGTVTGPSLNCGADCSITYGLNDTNIITAKPVAGSKFSGWQPEGDWCYSLDGKGSSKAVNLSTSCELTKGYTNVQNKTIVAKFDLDGSATASPSSSSPASSPKPTATTNTTTGTGTTEMVKITDTHSVKLVDAQGNEIVKDGENPIVFTEKQPIILTGKTVPNGVVKLYIFSEPQEATVAADSEGSWTYTIDSIDSGDHRVEVEVTNPATGEISARTEVLAFQVAQSTDTFEETSGSDAQNSLEEDESSSLPIILGGTVALILIGLGVVWWFVKKRRFSKGSETAATQLPHDSIENDGGSTPQK